MRRAAIFVSVVIVGFTFLIAKVIYFDSDPEGCDSECGCGSMLPIYDFNQLISETQATYTNTEIFTNPDNLTDDQLKWIYVITPTFKRLAQVSDLTSMAQTLMHVNNLTWIVIEDANKTDPALSNFLKEFHIDLVHLHSPTLVKHESHRGIYQRNRGLDWITKHHHQNIDSIVYFGDDDNTYHFRLFDEIRKVKKVGVWPVGFAGGFRVERPIVDASGKISTFLAWDLERKFPVDMAGFAINFRLIQKTSARFSNEPKRGHLESHFLEQVLSSKDELEPYASKCTKVLVWHTNTKDPRLFCEKKLAKKGARSDHGILV